MTNSHVQEEEARGFFFFFFLTGALRNLRKFYFPTVHMLVTGGQKTEVLSERHRQAMETATSEEAEFLPLCL